MTLPRPIHLNRRRWTSLIMIPLGLLIAISSPYGLVLFNQLFGREHAMALMVVAAICLLFLLIGISIATDAWRALTFNGPALVIDERGVTNYFDRAAVIPWQQIERIALAGSDTDVIVIDLRSGTDGADAPSLLRRVRRWIQRRNASGDVSIYLGDFVYSRKALKQQLREFHEWATARRAVADKDR